MASHETDLRAEVGSTERVARCQADHRSAGLDERTVALLDFAVKLTRAPRSMEESDVTLLRDLEFGDADILDAVQLISYFNYTNRVLDGLGVDPEPDMGYAQPRADPKR